MQEHEVWLTRFFNYYLGGFGNWLLALFGLHAEHPHHPWANFMTMQILVAAIIVVLFALLRPRLSMDRPGKLQQSLEAVYTFLRDEAENNIGHDGPKFLSFIGNSTETTWPTDSSPPWREVILAMAWRAPTPAS